MRGRLLVGGQLLLFLLLGTAPLWATEWGTPAAVTVLGALTLLGGLLLGGVALFHLGEAVTPLPEPRADATLVVGGLYRWVRHPVYSGVLAAAGGWTLLFPSSVTVAATVALGLLLHTKSGYEESLLRERYPDYDAYAARTPRFLPRPWRRSVSG